MSLLYDDDGGSELSGDAAQAQARFLTKGAFLLTPSHALSLDKAAAVCDALRLRATFSVTKTATGILFKFAEPDDCQLVYRKGFHRATGGRLYRKVAIPCRPQKTFSSLVHEVPADVPEEDVRAALYRYASVVEVTRVPAKADAPPGAPPPVRVTLAALDEHTSLLQTGLDFYGATYFPAEPYRREAVRPTAPLQPAPVFDAAGFTRLPAPASRVRQPRPAH